MSLMSVLDVAGSALTAQSIRLDLISGNMANTGVVASSEEEAFRARLPVFNTLYQQGISNTPVSGVEVEGISLSRVPIEERHSPDHPRANADGFIYESNVNMVEEMANMISASRSYTANVEVMNTSKQLLQRTLSIGT